MLIFYIGISSLGFANTKSKSEDVKQVLTYIDQLNTPFDPELIKAVAWVESEFNQFDRSNNTYVSGNRCKKSGKVSHDYGIMQLNDATLRGCGFNKKQMQRVKTDANFNICVGVAILNGKLKYIRCLKRQKNWKKIESNCGLKFMSDLDMAILAYNSLRKDHIYVKLVKEAMAEKPWNKLVCR